VATDCLRPETLAAAALADDVRVLDVEPLALETALEVEDNEMGVEIASVEGREYQAEVEVAFELAD
jgi:flavin-binding protein dodecin